METPTDVNAWAESVIKAWEDKINRLNIIDTRDLIKSLEFHIMTQANGDMARIDFIFNLYGKFEDMGASRNHPFTNPREKKPWLRAEFFSKVRILRQIIAAKYHRQASSVIVIDGAGIGNLK